MSGFAAIPNEVLNLPHTQFHVYMELARSAAGSDGYNGLHRFESRLSVRTISERLRLSKSYVHRVLKWLENRGHIRGQSWDNKGTVTEVYLLPGLEIAELGGQVGHGNGPQEGTSNNTHPDTHPDPYSNTHAEEQTSLLPAEPERPKTPNPEELEVLEYYQSRHPLRRVLRDGKPCSERYVTLVRRALKSFDVTELKRAIDGNADDEWHREKRKHELSYVLRGPDKISEFLDKAINVDDKPVASLNPEYIN